MTDIEIRLELAKAALHGNIPLTLKEAYEFVTAGEKGEEQTDKPVMGVSNHPLGDTYEEQEAAEEKIANNIYCYIRGMNKYDANEIIRNLLDPRQVSLNSATKIARLFITAHAKETILQELKDGNIKGTVPVMREVYGDGKKKDIGGVYKLETSVCSLGDVATQKRSGYCYVNENFYNVMRYLRDMKSVNYDWEAYKKLTENG